MGPTGTTINSWGFDLRWGAAGNNTGSAAVSQPQSIDPRIFPPDPTPNPLSFPPITPDPTDITPSPEPTETPQPTETPEPTETPRPTETPEPTETPRPTETPEPTETPRPTETPAPTYTTEEEELEEDEEDDDGDLLAPRFTSANALPPVQPGTYNLTLSGMQIAGAPDGMYFKGAVTVIIAHDGSATFAAWDVNLNFAWTGGGRAVIPRPT